MTDHESFKFLRSKMSVTHEIVIDAETIKNLVRNLLKEIYPTKIIDDLTKVELLGLITTAGKISGLEVEMTITTDTAESPA